MPLCHSKVEQVTTEDLFELSEIEKYNLGEVCVLKHYHLCIRLAPNIQPFISLQTRRTVSLSNVDNSPESLLAFSGINVHGLYDFLLNYR